MADILNHKNPGSDNCYDIIKAHGGEIKVETKEARPDDPVGRGEGAEFIIKLPLKETIYHKQDHSNRSKLINNCFSI